MTEAAVTLAAVGVSIVAVGAVLGACVTAARIRRAHAHADLEHIAAVGGWIVLTVFAGCSATSLWGQVLR